MNRSEAEEFTAALGQVMGGGYRMIRHAQREGVPQALGMTLEQWVNQHLGGYIRVSIEERREVAKELKDEGLSQREIAEVLGVGAGTVARDLGAPSGAKKQEESRNHRDSAESPAPLGAPDDDLDIPYEEVDPNDPATYVVSRETGEILNDDNADIQRIAKKDPDVDRARMHRLYKTAISQTANNLLPLKPAAVVASFAPGDADGARRFIANVRAWCNQIESEMDRGIRVIHRKEA